jgi:hypothetical protein
LNAPLSEAAGDKMASAGMTIANISGQDINDITIMSDHGARINSTIDHDRQPLIMDPVVTQMVEKNRPKTGFKSSKLSNHFDANILGYIFEKTNFNKENKTNLCKFGEFKLLNMNHNRQLLLGGGQSAPGNAGKYLSH